MSITYFTLDRKQFRKNVATASEKGNSDMLYIAFWASMGTFLNYRKSALARDCLRELWAMSK